ADTATEIPWVALPAAPVPTSLPPCWLHTPPLRVYTHAAPAPPLSLYPPTMAVFPSADTATEAPWFALLAAPVPTSLPPCWLHTPALRVYTHTAPTLLLSVHPPTTAVFPSADSATENPWSAEIVAPVPTSLAPCCELIEPGNESEVVGAM